MFFDHSFYELTCLIKLPESFLLGRKKKRYFNT